MSPITCVPKKNGTVRLVTDLHHLNSFSEPPKFKYEDINLVIKITQPKDYVISCALKDGFFFTLLSIRTTELCWVLNLGLLTTHEVYCHLDTIYDLNRNKFL